MTEQDVNIHYIVLMLSSNIRRQDSPLKIFLKKTRTLLKMSILTSLSLSITHIQRTEYGYTEESDEVYIKRLGVDDRYECCTIKDDDEYIAGRLTQSVSSDDIIDYLKHYGV